MILAGIILILAELLLIPGVGVAGILGVLSICGASWYAFAVLGPLTGAIVTIFNVVALAVLTCFALRSRTWKKFELNTVIGKNEAAPEVNAGDRGVVTAQDGTTSSASGDTAAAASGDSSPSSSNRDRHQLRMSYKEKKEWETIEADIDALETRIAAIDDEMMKYAQDFIKLHELTQEKEEKENLLDEKMERWAYLSDLQEQIDKN